MLLAGIIMIPYPGPGWLVVFIGLSILATEFSWAQRVHAHAHRHYGRWQDWLARQPLYIRALFWALTGLTVVLTLWLLNTYGFANELLHLGLPWLNSPFAR